MPVASRLPRQGRAVVLDCLLVFLIMAALLWPLFRLGFLDNWGSIESTFIADGRFLKDHWPRPHWQPLWYGGTRLDYVYPPALRYGTAGLAMLLHVEPVRAYHMYIAFFFAAGIAGVYLLARLGTGSRGAAWLAALGTALISPSYLLIPKIRGDGLHDAPWRLHVMVRYGEGPHITALALIGFAMLAAFYALRNGKPALIALAALFSALVVSNNFYGGTALAIFFPALCWAVWVTHRDRLVWLRAAAIVILSYGLAAWWLTPSVLRVTIGNMIVFSPPGHAWSQAVALLAAAGFAALTTRLVGGRREMAYTTFVSGACLFFCLLVLGFYFFDFRVTGDPGRFIPEMDMMLVLAAVEVLRKLWSGRIPMSPHWLKARPYVPRTMAACFVLLVAPVSWLYLSHAWGMYRPDPDYRERVEYTTSQWMAKNMPSARAFVSGSTRFWYDAWHDLAQVGGGSEWGVTNPRIFGAMWQMLLGERAEPGILWMQALGADVVVTHGPGSSEVYHDIQHWNRFAGVLPVLFDDGQDNVIYKVPRRYAGLARVVNRERLMARPVFHDGMDQVGNLKPYVALIEQGPDSPASFRWEGTDAMRIHARTGQGEGVLVQVSWDSAWHAYSGERALEVHKDPFGQMLIDTPPGEHDIRMVFETPFENRAGGAATVLSLLIVIGLAGLGTMNAPPDPTRWVARKLSRIRVPARLVGSGRYALGLMRAVVTAGPVDPRFRGAVPAACLAAIAAANFYIFAGLFFHPFTEHMNSMHGEWIALARLGRWFTWDPSWWPYWGGGVPLENAYAPLIPISMAAAAQLFHWTYGHALYVSAGLVSCALPLTLYAMAWRLTKAPRASFFAALAYTLLSPTEWIVPDAGFRWAGLLSGRRAYITVTWDDLPHLAALLLLPLFVILFRRYLGTRKPVWAFAGSVALAAMMVANMFGWTMAAIATLCVFLAEAGRRRLVFLSALAVAIPAYLVICPAVPPSLLFTIRQNSALDGEAVWNLRAAAALLIVAGGLAAILWAARRKRWSPQARFALLFGWILCAIPVLFQHARLHFLPQPGRYKFEMELALAVLAAFGIAYIGRRLPVATRTVGILVAVLAVPQIGRLRTVVDGMLQAPPVNQTIEYNSAKWVEEHLPGKRVFMGGSLGQWLNAFTAVPQLSAQPYTTTPNWPQQAATYITYAWDGERAGEISETWLRAFGVQAVAVAGPNSPEYWKSYRNPRKFEGVLPVLWRQDDTTIYGVPQRSAALGHVVNRESLMRAPVNYADITKVETYVNALEDPALPDPQFECATADRCSARADMKAGQVLSVQINYHPGWHARVNGEAAPISRDGLGLMYVAPAREGPCTIELTYDGSLEYKLCRIVSPLAGLLLIAGGFRRRR